MQLKESNKRIIDAAIEAIHTRGFYYQYPELPKAYDEQGEAKSKDYFSKLLNNDFNELSQTGSNDWVGEEVSPYLQVGLGIKYPKYSSDRIIQLAEAAKKDWSETSIEERANILIESLERIKVRFFDIAISTMHTTGQSYMMSFQASGPHANDRALETVALGYEELCRFPKNVKWTKPFGKFDLNINKEWKTIAKGNALVIGCSTFPVWNTVPGMFANLITGNNVIIKPHAKAILPIAIVIGEIQQVLKLYGKNPDTVLLASDSIEQPITKQLAEHASVKIIDYTGNTAFGNYIESLPKTTFTEKAGVNSIIIDSVNDMAAVAQNIAFSASLYSGQMCTAPQNIFIPDSGIPTNTGKISFDDVVHEITKAVTGLTTHPKAGASTLGAIQSDITLNRIKLNEKQSNTVVLASNSINNEEFSDARTCSPAVVVCDASETSTYQQECFGPIIFIVRTSSTEHSVELAKEIALTHGSISCGAYCTNESITAHIAAQMNEAFTPVSFNYIGAAFINQNAAFSDFHVTGGNPSGNASFTNPEYIVKRFVWVGNRYMA
ncbi:MAG: phenylacetic acid degradation protein PaaN [Bacteroidia bacterium]|nr:phenylacetic acid degradation protein PaaN [Bacteroidia bacterium]